MFKEENQIFLYLVGILVFFGIFILVGQNLNVTKIISFGRIFNNPDDLFDTKPVPALEPNANYYAIFNTSKGSFTVDLYENNAPNNVNNFVYLSKNNYYVDTKFHRLVPNVLVQGGDRNTLDTDPNNDGRGRAGYVLNDEINLSKLPLSQEQKDELIANGLKEDSTVETIPSKQYTLFMTNDGYDTISTQFFIVLADSSNKIHSYFNGKFTPIGEVTDGKSVLQSINSVSVDDPASDFARPSENIVLQNIAIQTR